MKSSSIIEGIPPRKPPFARAPPQTPPLSSKQLGTRDPVQPPYPLSFTKKSSEKNIKPDFQRRKSVENGSRPTVQMGDSLTQSNLESVRHPRHNTAGEATITEDLLQILKDENRNLKEQNNFLLSKIRQTNESQKALKEAVLHYELIVAQLSERNQQLHRENAELTQIASKRVEQFGSKLAELITDKIEGEPEPTGDFRIADPSFQQFQTSGTSNQYYQMLENRLPHQQFNSIPGMRVTGMPPIPPRPPKTEISTEPNDSELDELNNQFEALIYSCRVEKNPEKRKHIRKRLVELTYRMRDLKRN